MPIKSRRKALGRVACREPEGERRTYRSLQFNDQNPFALVGKKSRKERLGKGAHFQISRAHEEEPVGLSVGGSRALPFSNHLRLPRHAQPKGKSFNTGPGHDKSLYIDELMGSLQFLHWLCELLDSSQLRCFAEPESVSPTKEEEQNLLISLSQICKRVQRITDGSHLGSEQVIASQEIHGHSDPGSSNIHYVASHDCLSTIMDTLVSSLMIESQFVRHASRKIVLELSNFLLEYVDMWEKFVHFLCFIIEAAACSFQAPPSALRASVLDSILKRDTVYEMPMFSYRLKLKNTKSFTLVELIHILRKVFKDLGHNYGDHAKIYIKAIMVRLPAAVSYIINGLQTGQYASDKAPIYSRTDQGDILFGLLLQFLCSLVKKRGLEEDNEDVQLIGPLMIDLIPKVLSCLLIKDQISRLSQFLKHKILVLITRLCDNICQEQTLLLWLQLICNCYDDVLRLPLCGATFSHHALLEGSPFLASMVGEEKLHTCDRHLQRQTIFLLFKFAYNVINLSKETYVGTKGHQGSKPVVLELNKWLQRHMPVSNFVIGELYVGECQRFALLFLQLFLDEDDLLFEMLLLLLEYSNLLQKYSDPRNINEEMKEDTLVHFATIFNPVLLFHLFLAEIQYDHSMLLDCLISKDSGVLCVRYLLRCMRVIASSWDVFVEFPMLQCIRCSLSCKRTKFYHDPNDSLGKEGSSTSTEICCVTPGGSDGKAKQASCAFKYAMGCLLSLKRSIEKLHKRKLFPYNPTALLRSFVRFEDQCKAELEIVDKED